MDNRFKRYEKKYYLSEHDYTKIIKALDNHIVSDEYHKYTIKNVYFDNDSYGVVRHSISKPVFKQKLRLRSYDNESVFFELKKKYNKEVFKRRVVLDMDDFYNNDFSEVKDKLTLKEIMYFMNHMNVYPKVKLQYDREAYKGIEDSNLRITFDSNLLFSLDDLDLRNALKDGIDRLDGHYIMEIKARQVIPRWLSKILDDLELYPGPFSKYGYCYKNHIINNKDKKEVEACLKILT